MIKERVFPELPTHKRCTRGPEEETKDFPILPIRQMEFINIYKNNPFENNGIPVEGKTHLLKKYISTYSCLTFFLKFKKKFNLLLSYPVSLWKKCDQ